ncbi:MAG: aminopeptidase, partial [Stecheria intestinalis]|nr:aminopeptidase [Stecheria intestinalis]
MEEIYSRITDQLIHLTSIASPTGYTQQVTDYLISVLSELGYHPERSRKGNVSVTLGGDGNPLVLAAHVDTLGAMVRSIKANGRLRPTTLGGHQWRTADGENCTVFTRDGRSYTGMVLNTEPSAHVADTPVEIREENMEILLDENIHDKAGAEALGIETGDIIAMDPKTVITPSGYIKSRFLDDKLSSAILIGLAAEIAEKKIALKRKVTLLFTVYEEVGHGGCVVPEDTEDMISVDMGCVG